MDVPKRSKAFAGQASAQAPHPRQRSRSMTTPSGVIDIHPFGQASMQVSQPMQRFSSHCTWTLKRRLSGLWHQPQRSGQPFIKTVVRIPGPSSVESRCRCRNRPVFSSSVCLSIIAHPSATIHLIRTTLFACCALSPIPRIFCFAFRFLRPLHTLPHPVALSGNDLILQLFADAGEIGVVTGDTHQKVTVVFGMLLGIAQHFGIDQVDL